MKRGESQKPQRDESERREDPGGGKRREWKGARQNVHFKTGMQTHGSMRSARGRSAGRKR
eukprot:5763412-Pyramimonas_sp.AAC.1